MESLPMIPDDIPHRFTVLTVPRRLDRLRRDPWKDYLSDAQII
jgi:DNA primase